MTAPTLAPRLFGGGNVVHDVVEWKGPEQPSHTYTWGITRCGMRGKTYDVEMWRRGTPTACKNCEARRGDAAETEFAHAKAIAAYFHRMYEELAPDFGYATRRESAVPWDDVPEQNKRLMIATVGGLLHVGVIKAGEAIADGT